MPRSAAFHLGLRCLKKYTLKAQWDTLIFSYKHRLGSYFWVQNFEFEYFWGFSEKIIVFIGMKILWKFFWGSSQHWTIFRGYLYAF